MGRKRFTHLYERLVGDDVARINPANIARIVEEFRLRNADSIKCDIVDEDVVLEGHQIQEALVGLIADGLCDDPLECANLVAEGTSFDALHDLVKKISSR